MMGEGRAGGFSEKFLMARPKNGLHLSLPHPRHMALPKNGRVGLVM